MVALSSRLEQANKIKLEFKYDYMGRRIEKKVSTYNGTTWVVDSTVKFVYDGYLQIANFDVGASTTLNQSFLWSGMQPLTMKDHTSGSYYLYVHDGNKNVTNLIKASDASTVAEYEYDPFGRTIISNGSLADSNPFRFSSEYADDETGLVYYNYRYYDAETGRWLNRDPIEESGGNNLYGFVRNDAINFFDYLGRDSLYSGIYNMVADNEGIPRIKTKAEMARIAAIDNSKKVLKTDEKGIKQIHLLLSSSDTGRSNRLRHSNFGELMNNAKEAITSCECISILELEGHSHPSTFALSKKN